MQNCTKSSFFESCAIKAIFILKNHPFFCACKNAKPLRVCTRNILLSQNNTIFLYNLFYHKKFICQSFNKSWNKILQFSFNPLRFFVHLVQMSFRRQAGFDLSVHLPAWFGPLFPKPAVKFEFEPPFRMSVPPLSHHSHNKRQ